MEELQGLPPVESPGARLLILGSMPGRMSLRTRRYYAHPQNLFWAFMGELAGASPALPYETRIERLRAARVALWDVIGRCCREGSLDSAIRGEVANDFAGFFAQHRALRSILFNGAKAEETFRRQVPPGDVPAGVALRRLPSTSPANRSMPVADRFAWWREAFAEAGVGPPAEDATST